MKTDFLSAALKNTSVSEFHWKGQVLQEEDLRTQIPSLTAFGANLIQLANRTAQAKKQRRRK